MILPHKVYTCIYIVGCKPNSMLIDVLAPPPAEAIYVVGPQRQKTPQRTICMHESPHNVALVNSHTHIHTPLSE